MKRKNANRFAAIVTAGAVALSGALVAWASPISTRSAVTGGAEAAMSAPGMRCPGETSGDPVIPCEDYTVTTTIKLTTRPKSPVPAGRKVKILGVLSASGGTPAGALWCQALQPITGTKSLTTDASGRFFFKKKITKATRIRANFAGATHDIHPDSFTCTAASKRIRIKVRR